MAVNYIGCTICTVANIVYTVAMHSTWPHQFNTYLTLRSNGARLTEGYDGGEEDRRRHHQADTFRYKHPGEEIKQREWRERHENRPCITLLFIFPSFRHYRLCLCLRINERRYTHPSIKSASGYKLIYSGYGKECLNCHKNESRFANYTHAMDGICKLCPHDGWHYANNS